MAKAMARKRAEATTESPAPNLQIARAAKAASDSRAREAEAAPRGQDAIASPTTQQLQLDPWQWQQGQAGQRPPSSLVEAFVSKERHEIATSWDSGSRARVGSSPETRRLSATSRPWRPTSETPCEGSKTRRVDADEFSTERLPSP